MVSLIVHAVLGVAVVVWIIRSNPAVFRRMMAGLRDAGYVASSKGHGGGWTLARAHARAGDAIAITGYLGSGDAFDRALAWFAERYADQNERDYAALQDAVASGRVAAVTGA